MFIYSDWYKCSSCGVYGKTTSLLARLEGKPVRTSQKSFHPHLWNYLDEDVDVESLAITAHHRYELNPDVGYYFKQRGIASEAKRLLFGYLDGWYTFPVLGEHHEIQGLVARAGYVAEQNYGVRYVVPPKQAPMLYVPDWNLVAESPYVFLTLGIIDAISASLAGFPAVSGTAGHFLPVEMFDKMRKLIYILPDGDGKDFLSEVVGIMESYTSYKVGILCFDTQVYNYAEFTKDNEADIMSYECKGGGGTSFEAFWDYWIEHE